MSAPVISRPTTTDDNGTRKTGTIFNHAWWEDVWDRIDALAASLYALVFLGQQTTTLTGSQNNFALTAGVSVLRCNNATLLSLTGITAGVAGQRLVIVSVGAGQVDLAHSSGSSSVGNKFKNFATSGVTSLAAGTGSAEYEYDSTAAVWRLLWHEQGAWITRTFSAANYTTNGAGGWTVPSVITDAYRLIGKTLHFSEFTSLSTVTAATGTELRVALPAGYTAAARQTSHAVAYDSGTTKNGIAEVQAGVAYVRVFMDVAQSTNWTAAATNTYANFAMSFEVQ